MLHASLEWGQGPSFVRRPPGAVPKRGNLGSFVSVHLSASKTRGDSSQGIWDMSVPCRLKHAESQAPVTGNLTQITKGSSDCV